LASLLLAPVVKKAPNMTIKRKFFLKYAGRFDAKYAGKYTEFGEIMR